MKIKKYDININFWDEYPMFKSISPFSELRKKDKKASHGVSSRFMWAFAVYVDTTGPLKNLSDQEKISIINDDFIPGKLDTIKYKKHIDKMRSLILSKEASALHDLFIKLEERTALIKDTRYTIENASKLDKLIADTDGILQAIKKMESFIEAGSSDGAVKGGRSESASEQGLL